MKHFLLLALVLSSTVTLAQDEVLFAPTPKPKTTRVSLEQVQAAPAYAENEKLVLDIADAKLDDAEKAGLVDRTTKEEIRGFMKKLPFRRIVDLEIIFPGFPDGVGLCLEGNPTDYLSIEACAGTIIWISSVGLSAKSRFLRYLNIKRETSPNGKTRYKGWQLSAGPGIGKRDVAVFALFGFAKASAIDAFVSAEATRWYSKNFGLSFQLDLGAMYMYGNEAFNDDTTKQRTLPMGKLTVGFTF